MKISELRNLGPKSEEQLAVVGIHSAEELIELGSAQAYVRIKLHFKTSLNFLYAMEGALTDVSCISIPVSEKVRLQIEVECLEEMYRIAESEE